LNDSFGIEKSMFTTVHGYTSSQALVDGSARKPARGRAAALNIVPTTTGASDAVFEVIPELKGKIQGMAIRVPVAAGSLVDLTAELSREVLVEEVIEEFKKAERKKMKGVLSCISEPLVSTDIVGNPFSSIVAIPEIKVSGSMVKVLAWYDNEWGYSSRVVDVIKLLK